MAECQRSLLQAQRKALPIASARDALLREIRSHDCCVVVGETGSGKTTQIPQYILESGLGRKGCVGVTQPRRVAAVSIAIRVALERCCPLGQEVGYSVRFDDKSSPATKLKYLTDGMLLREAISDPLLSRYSVILLDEAHERTVHTDILFGVVKTAQKIRSEKQLKKLRIIVMSATLAAESFSNYFNKAKILYIQGRQFPVEIFYTAIKQQDYTHATVTTVLQLHEDSEKKGDILVFLTGREEIESVNSLLTLCKVMFPSDWLDMIVFPFYAALPTKKQQDAFLPARGGARKVILSTNVAETSITIPNIRYVVDCGMVKAKGYNPHIGLDLLSVQPVSKAQARQRAGRAGREAPGACYRLYTEDYFAELLNDTVPEIQRSSLSSVILQLLALGISNIVEFDFMDPPSEESLVRALEQLYLLGAIETDSSEEGVKLTALGLKMAQFPLEPSLAKTLLSAGEHGCGVEIVNIVSMLSVDSVLFTPQDKRERALESRRKFVSPDGDHLMLLKIYRAFKSVKGNKSWCHENFIHMRHMSTVMDVRRQLTELCGRVGVELGTGGAECSEGVRRALIGGLFMNIAEHAGEGKYLTHKTRQQVYIHPSSCLFHVKPHPPCVVYSELVYTSKCYMRNVSVVESDWSTTPTTPR
ncbi:ATP-dependent RNA helicase DHX33-like [Halichondria panicea]|uniref:ATP-dependent RNA helicase DHX33-like n=1 Tax=Halichondria panicea TaxID=6063 RepID=UPI00312BBA75